MRLYGHRTVAERDGELIGGQPFISEALQEIDLVRYLRIVREFFTLMVRFVTFLNNGSRETRIS